MRNILIAMLVLMTTNATAQQLQPPDAIPADHDMTFLMTTSGILAEGNITLDTPNAFKNFLAENPNANRPGMLVSLISEGGVISGGLSLGLLFRMNSLSTFVGTPGILGTPVTLCASACTLAFIGGVERFVGRNARFEVHSSRRIKKNGDEYNIEEKAFSLEDIADMRKVDAYIIRYLRNQGVDPLFAACMFEVPPWNSHPLTLDVMRQWRVDNQSSLTPDDRDILQNVDSSWMEPCSPSPEKTTSP